MLTIQRRNRLRLPPAAHFVATDMPDRNHLLQPLPPVREHRQFIRFFLPFRRQQRQDSLPVRRDIVQESHPREGKKSPRRIKCQTSGAFFHRDRGQLAVTRKVIQLLAVVLPSGAAPPWETCP